MPAKSQAQQKMMGIAKAIKEGKTAPSYSPQGASMAKSMTMDQLREFATTPRRGLPKKKTKNNKPSSMPPMAKGALPRMGK